MLPDLQIFPMRSRYLLEWLDIPGVVMYSIHSLSEKAVFE